MTEAENVISKGLGAVMYTKGKGKGPTQQSAQWKPEEKARTRQFSGLSEARSLVCYLERGKQSTPSSIAFHSLNPNPVRSHMHFRDG